MKSPLVSALFAAVILVGAGQGVPAGTRQPDIRVNYSYYKVAGRTAAALRQHMHVEGDKNHWAFTRWRVSWSSDCDVRVSITYYLPRLKDRAQVSLPLRNRWDRMIANLKVHERGHGENGKNAGLAVLAAGCKHPKAIIQNWQENDRVYDEVTQHGLTQGVKLGN